MGIRAGWITLVKPLKRVSAARLQSIDVQIDQSGQIVIKCKHASEKARLHYEVQVYIIFPEALHALELHPFQHIWQSIRDLKPDSSIQPDVAAAVQLRSRVRAALHCITEPSSPVGYSDSIALLTSEAGRLLTAKPSTTMEYMFVEMQRALMIAHDACQDKHLLQSLHQLQNEHAKRNYLSTQAKGARLVDEQYLQKLKNLKQKVRLPVTIRHVPKATNHLLVDILCCTFSAIAMTWAIVALWIGWKVMGSPKASGITLQMTIPFAAITVAAYCLKDRIKAWGDRYVYVIASRFGAFLPDHVSHLCDSDMAKVGTCEAVCKVISAVQLPKHLQSLHNRYDHVHDKALHFAKRCLLDMRKKRSASQDVAVLDRTSIDLSFLYRNMKPSWEDHWFLDIETQQLRKVSCARVYNVGVIVAAGKGEHAIEKRYQLSFHQGGPLRLEQMKY